MQVVTHARPLRHLHACRRAHLHELPPARHQWSSVQVPVPALNAVWEVWLANAKVGQPVLEDDGRGTRAMHPRHCREIVRNSNIQWLFSVRPVLSVGNSNPTDRPRFTAHFTTAPHSTRDYPW